MLVSIVENGAQRSLNSAEFREVIREVEANEKRQAQQLPMIWNSLGAQAIIKQVETVARVRIENYPSLVQAFAKGNFDTIPEDQLPKYFRVDEKGALKLLYWGPANSGAPNELQPCQGWVLPLPGNVVQPSTLGFLPGSACPPFAAPLGRICRVSRPLLGMWSLIGNGARSKHFGMIGVFPDQEKDDSIVFAPGAWATASAGCLQAAQVQFRNFDGLLRHVSGKRKKAGYCLYELSDSTRFSQICGRLQTQRAFQGSLQLLDPIPPDQRLNALVALLVDAGPLRRRFLLRDLNRLLDQDLQAGSPSGSDMRPRGTVDTLGCIAKAVNLIHCRSSLVTNCRYMAHRVLRVAHDLVGLQKSRETPDFQGLFPKTHFQPDTTPGFRNSLGWRFLIWLLDVLALIGDFLRDLLTRRKSHIARAARACPELGPA